MILNNTEEKGLHSDFSTSKNMEEGNIGEKRRIQRAKSKEALHGKSVLECQEAEMRKEGE